MSTTLSIQIPTLSKSIDAIPNPEWDRLVLEAMAMPGSWVDDEGQDHLAILEEKEAVRRSLEDSDKLAKKLEEEKEKEDWAAFTADEGLPEDWSEEFVVKEVPVVPFSRSKSLKSTLATIKEEDEDLESSSHDTVMESGIYSRPIPTFEECEQLLAPDIDYVLADLLKTSRTQFITVLPPKSVLPAPLAPSITKTLDSLFTNLITIRLPEHLIIPVASSESKKQSKPSEPSTLYPSSSSIIALGEMDGYIKASSEKLNRLLGFSIPW
jgi:hypothetical protein